MVLLTNLAAVVSPWILRSAVDDLTVGVSHQKLLLYAALMLSFNLAEGSFRFLMRRILIGLSRTIEFDLRNDLYAQLQRLSPSFYSSYSTGDPHGPVEQRPECRPQCARTRHHVTV